MVAIVLKQWGEEKGRESKDEVMKRIFFLILHFLFFKSIFVKFQFAVLSKEFKSAHKSTLIVSCALMMKRRRIIDNVGKYRMISNSKM